MIESGQKTWHEYDYAILRLVPRVQLGEFYNVGIVMHARTAGFLGLKYLELPGEWKYALPESLDESSVLRHLKALQQIADAEVGTDFLGSLTPSERFHWLTAPRSAVIQTSELHSGKTTDPAATLEHLYDWLTHRNEPVRG